MRRRGWTICACDVATTRRRPIYGLSVHAICNHPKVGARPVAVEHFCFRYVCSSGQTPANDTRTRQNSSFLSEGVLHLRSYRVVERRIGAAPGAASGVLSVAGGPVTSSESLVLRYPRSPI